VNEASRQELSIRDYVALLRRRKLILIGAILVAPACAIAVALHQKPVYQATATDATKEGNIAATVAGVQDFSFYADPNRLAATQIALAETPAVAAQVLRRAHIKDMSPGALLGETSIAADPSADILFFTVKDLSSQRAAQLANAYAEQYTVFRSQEDTGAYRKARADILTRATELRAQGKTGYANSLDAKAQQLQTYSELLTKNAVVADLAGGGVQISPRTKRDAAFGLVLGIVLGIGLAFLRDALDTRIRGAEDIARRTGMVLLARIPEPPKKLQREDELVIFAKPTSVEAEAFRVLRTNMDFAALDQDLRTVMITSALEKEGKSTTIANLAVVQARAGMRVVLVDLDLRRPKLDKFFQLQGRPGLTNVILGHTSLEEATAHIPLGIDARRNGDGGASGNGAPNGNGHAPIEGMLDVIPSGPIPPDPGEFVSTAALSRLLETLADRYDMVLIDAPPLLRVGDGLTLASKVSALLVATRLPGMRRPIVNELRRVLETVPARTLGFVVTGAQAAEGYGQGYYYDYKQRRTSRSTTEPVA
jgi:polysaccharide biosynthesis transport protein